MLMRDRSRVLLGGFFSSLGLPGLGQGTPSKVTIWYEMSSPRDYSEKFELPFNPATLSSSSTVRWRTTNLAATVQKRSYALSYCGDGISPATLSFDVSIDTYEGAPGGGGGGWGNLVSVPNPTALHVFTPPSGVSVLPYTAQIAGLQQVNSELHRPPLCDVWWGNVKLIEGPLTSLNQQYTRFLPDGTPVRAKLSCTFTDASVDRGELNSSDVQKTHTVRLGDTLQAIAARCYGAATRWRVIAEANDIDDPRTLIPGTVLTIPAIR